MSGSSNRSGSREGGAVKPGARRSRATAARTTPAPRRPTVRPEPTYQVERELLAAGATVVAGVDEVGRGAWAGPVVVAAAVTALTAPPKGLTDSKLLTARRREELADLLTPWVSAHAFGEAQAEEIDELGMTAALRLAAERALSALPTRPDAVVLDGKHDYLGPPWNVRCVIKGDLHCVSVAAASVLAKVHRDADMARLGESLPDFAFCDNAGYPSPVHRRALERLGPTALHRRSWAYMDDLPAWRHLKKVRSVPENPGQIAFEL